MNSEGAQTEGSRGAGDDRRAAAVPSLSPSDLGIGVLFQILTEALLVVEMATERLVLFNPAAERLFALSPDQAAGLPLDRLLPGQPLALLSSKEGRPVAALARSQAGHTLAVEVSVAPLVGPSDAYMVLAIRDVSERERAEARSLRRETQLAEAEHIAQVGSWLRDLAHDRLHWSDELYRIAGQSPDSFEPTVEAFMGLLHPEDRAPVRAITDRALEDGAPCSYYARLVRPDGGIRTLHCRGRLLLSAGGPVGLVGTVQDVTEPLRLEAALRESEARLRAIVDQATDGIWIKDLEGRHILINPAGAAIAGHTVETALGCTDAELYPPETARRITEIDARVIATGRGETYEITVVTETTGPRTYFSIKYPYVREDGTIHGIVVITRDITERKRLDQALHVQYERLKELDRLKTDFVNAVSHELRTPLTSIRGYLEFMEDGIGGTLSPSHEEFVREIERAAGRLTLLVDDLLDFARIQAGTFELRSETFDLTDKIHELAGSLVPQADKAQVSLEVTAEQPLFVHGDPQRLGQVLLNLANNAIKFTPSGGKVELRGRIEGDCLRCEVRDTGPGIAPDDVPRLFHKFSQLSEGRSKGGSGLGLSISKAIVEAHGGSIGVESRPGLGSVFWFTLPIA